ncbi:glycosyltransferase family 1 protein [Verrucomicrobia bacterium LW23]|nr:glycosyltransferase family 1 protein [Verrucomicrobia bacterium LW23]
MKQHIAVISDHASPLASPGGVNSGGQNVYVAQIARHLAARGHHVDIYTRRDDPEQPEVYRWKDRIRVIHVPAGPPRHVDKEELMDYMPQFTSFIISFIMMHEISYDVVHANFWMSGMVALDIKDAFNIPFVITFHALGRIRRIHQDSADRFPNQRQEIEELLARKADRILTACPQDEEDLLNHYGAHPSRFVMVPCGFDPTEMRRVNKLWARWSLRLPLHEFIAVQVGRMVPRKGVDNAIRGFARFRKQSGARARLLVVGGESCSPDPALTPEIGRLQEVAREEEADNSVIFTGRRSREALRYYYSAADVFITTPWYEPFGITPLEAMACGAVVVASDVGGLKYTVRHGETGYLVPPHHPNALAERLAFLWRYPRRRRKLAEAGEQRVYEHFRWDQIARSLEAVYGDVAHPRALRTEKENIIYTNKTAVSPVG